MARPWSDIPIVECGEPLRLIPSWCNLLEPHPYVAVGAPYGEGVNPYMLRIGVIHRLSIALQTLQRSFPELSLIVYDAWRPIAVQAYMVEYSIDKECRLRGINRHLVDNVDKVKKIVDLVATFWASPSLNPSTPPPHSTGGALDLTLADSTGMPIDMGGEIDAIGSISQPDYYAEEASKNPNSKKYLWDFRRRLLTATMVNAGFAQHPNEWWHFSYGDQLWAWKYQSEQAIYGAQSHLSSNE